jgi:hypothetical protein
VSGSRSSHVVLFEMMKQRLKKSLTLQLFFKQNKKTCYFSAAGLNPSFINLLAFKFGGSQIWLL